ncbi:MAG TPA: hypothetical protein VGA79_04520 [Desulfobaccales bacterium]|jgi:hypothetical protein
MKKLSIFSLAACCAAVLALAVVYNETNFNAQGRMYQPAPEGHLIGKDNGPGVGLHHPGEVCSRCHSMGGRAEAYPWTMAGTLYADRSGRTVLKGGEIILQDRDGNVISMTSNEAGNFWTTAPIASNPYTVASHGGMTEPLYVLDENGNLVQPADPANPSTWLYKTWVRKGFSVRPMVTIAPAGGSTGMPMSCNMHHGNMGSRGALWVSPAPTLPSYPESGQWGLSYRKHIYPILRSKCSPCHIPGNTMTRLVTKSDLEIPSTSIDHSCSLDLMAYEGSTGKRGVLDVVDPDNPEQSLLLRKTVFGGIHSGGAFWKDGDPDYLALRQWIAEGAPGPEPIY